ncbi:MAG: primosomal protein N' [Blastocatellia bacterium]|nr:primosomal protein N' [Blastocatellia bacterium]
MPQVSDIPADDRLFVAVALPIPIRRNFTYRLPLGLRDKTAIGSRLTVPFGKRSMIGYAVGFSSDLSGSPDLDPTLIKDAIELIDEKPLLSEEIIALTKWTADYYAAAWGEVLKASLPAGINTASERIVRITEAGLIHDPQVSTALKWEILNDLHTIRERAIGEIEKKHGKAPASRAIRDLAKLGFIALEERAYKPKLKPKLRKAVRLIDNADIPAKLTDLRQKVIDTLRDHGGDMFFQELLDQAGVAASPVTTLARSGVVEIYLREILRDPITDTDGLRHPELTLNPEQQGALKEIEKALGDNQFQAFLLHGITGSGKTEVYIRAMRSTLERGGSALMLVPEISLTPIFSRRLRAVFGRKVAILHSSLSPGERFDEWRRIRSGAARIAIGTRSAIFAPLGNLRLIIIDEEHDPSYRQNESPYYSARDVAVMRAHMASAVALLGSATPSLETFHNAKTGKYRYLQLPHRIGGRPLAKAELIDMREVFKRFGGKDVILAPQFIEAIDEAHRKGEQSIILLNRRGFSSFVLCRSCGERLRCKNCDITMTYHRRNGRMVCHYCDHAATAPSKCPFCESTFLYFIGQGTEQIEDVLIKKFSHLKIVRIDRDSMTRKGEMTKTLLAFDRGEIDMLVGTQMIAKGHDFPNVTLVGVVSVDAGLGFPDFRAAERTFQLLTQVAGRAGRGSLPGRVLIQTYYPEHYALRHASEQDFDGFYTEEIRYRQRMNYPPFVVLASIMIKHRDQNYAMRSAKLLRDALDLSSPDRASRILGPAPAPIARIKNEYRFQIIVKSPSRVVLRETLDQAFARAETSGTDLKIVHLEIDPVSMM